MGSFSVEKLIVHKPCDPRAADVIVARIPRTKICAYARKGRAAQRYTGVDIINPMFFTDWSPPFIEELPHICVSDVYLNLCDYLAHGFVS